MDTQIVEKYFVIRFAVDGRTGQATIGMIQYDAKLAQAMLADRLGRKPEEITVLSHRTI